MVDSGEGGVIKAAFFIVVVDVGGWVVVLIGVVGVGVVGGSGLGRGGCYCYCDGSCVGR